MTATPPDTVMLQSDLPLPKRSGKVRDIYDLGDRLLLVATDRVSAFDVVLPTGIPDKGRVLTQMSAFWFESTRSVVPNHMLRVIDSTQNPDLPVSLGPEYVGRTMLVRKAEPVPLEAIVRGYLAGSGWAEYQRSGSVTGIRLPQGLRESDPLPQPLFTPSTKAETGHDENITFTQAVNIVGEEIANQLKVRALALYIFALERALASGFIIADTKFEFGLADSDEGARDTILIDEAVTPDSSRFWEAAAYTPGQPQPAYDKQLLRDWLERSGWNKGPPAPPVPADVVEQLRARYLSAFERLSGRTLVRP